MKTNVLIFICFLFLMSCGNNSKPNDKKVAIDNVKVDNLREKGKELSKDPNLIIPQIPLGRKVKTVESIPGVIYVDNLAYNIDTMDCGNDIRVLRYNKAGIQGQMHSVTGEIDFASYGLGGAYKSEYSSGGINVEDRCFKGTHFDSLTIEIDYKFKVPCKYIEKFQTRAHPMNVDSPIAADLIGDIPFIVDVFEDQNRLTSTQYEINLENEYWPKLNSFEPKTLPVVQNGDRYFADHNGFSVWCFDEEIVCYSEIKVLLTFPIRTKAPLQFYNYYVALQIENNDVLLHDDHTHKGEGANEGPCNVRPNTLNDYLYQNNNEYCDHLAKHTEIIGIPICGFDFGGIENQISIPVNFEAQQQNQAR